VCDVAVCYDRDLLIAVSRAETGEPLLVGHPPRLFSVYKYVAALHACKLLQQHHRLVHCAYSGCKEHVCDHVQEKYVHNFCDYRKGRNFSEDMSFVLHFDSPSGPRLPCEVLRSY